MKLKKFTNSELIRYLESATELFQNKVYYTKTQVEKFLGLSISRAGFYGIVENGEITYLSQDRTVFDSPNDVTILVEGVVSLDNEPTNIGGSVIYTGYGLLEVNGTVIYNGKSISDSPIDGQLYGRKNNAWYLIPPSNIPTWGDIQGLLSDQTDLTTLLNQKADINHTHPVEDITGLGALAPLNTVSTTEIDDNAVTNNKLDNMPVNTVKGSVTGEPVDLTASQIRTIINVEDGATADQTPEEIATAYNSQVLVVTQNDAEAGVLTNVFRWTPQRVKQAIEANALVHSDVVDNLNSSSTDTPLSANQGRILQLQIAGLGDMKVVADDTERDALIGLSKGDMVHVSYGGNWVRWQITAVTDGLWATSTKIVIATFATAGGTNLGYVPSTRTITSDTGSDTVLPLVVANGDAGLMSGTDKTKLNDLTNYIHPNHTGDVTSTGDGATTISNGAVTNAKMANVATQTFKGRTSAGTGVPEDLTIAQAKALLGLSGNNTGDQTITLTGDVTGSGNGSFAATVSNDAITNSKLSNVAVNTIKGRITEGTGDPEDLTPTQVRTILNVVDGANNYAHPNHTGDVTSLGDGTTTIANGVVTNSKLATMPAGSLKGKSSANGTPDDLVIASLAEEIAPSDGDWLLIDVGSGILRKVNAKHLVKPVLQKVLIIENPLATDDYPLLDFTIPVTITRVTHQVFGATNVSFNISHSGGTDLWASDKVATTTKVNETTFTDATCTANNQVRYQASAITGTPTKIEVTITYTED